MKRKQILFSIFRLKRGITTLICIFLFYFVSVSGYSQISIGCPPLNGGRQNISLIDGASHQTIFPGDVPSGLTGLPQNTVGYLTSGGEHDAGTVYPNKDITIYPRLAVASEIFEGSVVLKFDILDLPSPDSRVQIYSGTSVLGLPLLDINSLNAADYLGMDIVISGPVTVRFYNLGTAAGSNFNVMVKFMTGDQVITSCQGKEVAIWTSFMPSDGYTFVDDYGDAYGGNSAPICVGYFDENQQFVSSELSLCLDYHRDVASVMWGYYPGEIVYTLNPYEEHDIDRSGAYNDTDKVKNARLLWILSNAPMSTKLEQLDAQLAVWSTLENSLTHSFASALASSAQVNVPATPVPFEPEFSITSTITNTIAGLPLEFTIDFDIDGGSSSRVLIDPSAGITINSVVGDGYYDSGTGQIIFTSLPATVIVNASSDIALSGSIRVVYDEPGFWNLNNLAVYNSCSDEVQDFIGLASANNLKPMREISAVWEADPMSVNLHSFSAEIVNELTLLNWSTATEQDNKGFSIFRSADGIKWESIGFVNSRAIEGNSASSISYSHLDDSKLNGTVFYRLKQIDLNGKFSYSKIEKVAFNNLKKINIYPNPVNTMLELKGLSGNDEIVIFNSFGEALIKKNSSSSTINIDVRHLATGTYFITVFSVDNNKTVIRFVKL